ncbi:MAG: PD40 domain-containing protein [Gammaproteobacteria bacterium]|nr:PD40 domain-containing protein [Gammaproteobacteria bacterium]
MRPCRQGFAQGRAVLFSTLLLPAVLTGCGPSPVDPTQTGGEWADTAVEVSCGDAPRFSPDGQQLAFWVSYSPDPATVPPVTRLGLMDWPAGPARLPDGQDEALSLNPQSLCWQGDHAQVHVAGIRRDDFRTRYWFALDDDDMLVPVDSRPPDCRVRQEQLWESHRPEKDTPAITRGLNVSHPDSRTVVLAFEGGQELTRHQIEHRGATMIYVRHYSWSPDGRRLAYSIGESRGAWTAGPLRTYLVEAAGGEPQVLASGLHWLGWRDEDELVGCGRRRAGRDNRLVRWRSLD